MVEMNAKLELALTAKQESEAKVTGLETKVVEYEKEIADLKEKVSEYWFEWCLYHLGYLVVRG